MDFWKYSKQETPLTELQLLGSIEKKKNRKKKISRIIYGFFHRDQAIPKSEHLPRSEVNLQWKETKFCWCVFLPPTLPHPNEAQ